MLITESPNELTTGIDVASPRGIVSLLGQSDAQLFRGYGEHDALVSARCAGRVVRAAELVARAIAAEQLVVMCGAGTSGRLAFLAARQYNRMFENDGGSDGPLHYLIAGGDGALLKSQEGAEDSAKLARDDLARMEERHGRRVGCIIGITCGFSVRGQPWPVLRPFGPAPRSQDCLWIEPANDPALWRRRRTSAPCSRPRTSAATAAAFSSASTILPPSSPYPSSAGPTRSTACCRRCWRTRAGAARC